MTIKEFEQQLVNIKDSVVILPEAKPAMMEWLFETYGKYIND